MDSWTLEKAKNGFSEVVRRALDHKPQVVTRGGRAEEAVVVVAKTDYERLTAPQNLVDFFRESPLAKAIAQAGLSNEQVDDLFARTREMSRDLEF